MRTTRKNASVADVDVWRRRFDNWRRTLFAPGDLMALICAIGLLLMSALSLNAGGWPLQLTTLIPVLVLSVLIGFMLSRSTYNEVFALLLSGLIGLGLVLFIAAINEPGNIADGLYSVLTRMTDWLIDAFTGGINQDETVFTILVALLFWYLGYNASWHMFRVDRVWRVILPPGLILISNSIFYTGPNNLDVYLIIFVGFSLLLVVRSHLDAREWDWYVNGIRVPGNLRSQFWRVGAIMSLIVLLVGWSIPSGDLQERLNRFQEFMQAEPLQQLAELWNRLFANIDSQGPATADYYGGDSLELGGAIRLGEQVVFWVSAPPENRYYWRSRVFDTYEGGRWLPAADTRLTDADGVLDINLGVGAGASRIEIQQTYTMGVNASRLLYAAPQPLTFNMPARADLRNAPDTSMNISVVRPINVLYRGDTYTATSLMTVATADELRNAGTTYPLWINDLYLYVSPSVTARTVELAAQIIAEAGAVTPYDQAKAIESWLRANILYNETIPTPPEGRDPVDWVLFDYREGYCNYYASAMIVMLRSLGIPARMAAGFAQGDFDPTLSAFVVEERDAHTWVEVFFPGYGWIEFEPTAAQAPLNRDGDQNQEPQSVPTSTPQASATPTLTPTPSATPTNTTPTPPEAQQFIPTSTPTPTPSPTQTPVIVPTQPPPMRQQPRGLLSYILPILGGALVFLLVVAIIAAIGTFIWWWWEWRGMRGMSPVVRAYARLERYLGLLGIKLQPQQTPEERRRRIVKDLPSVEPPVTAITRLYSAERYGPESRQGKAQGETADRAWTDTRGNILQRFLKKLFRLRWKG